MGDTRMIYLPTDQNPSVVLSSLASESTSSFPDLVEADGETLGIVIADPDPLGDGYVSRVIPDGTTIECLMGTPDVPPTGGTFDMVYGTDVNFLTAIPFDFSASSLQSALNRNPTRATAGPVTVTQSGGCFIIADVNVGARAALTADGSMLAPFSVAKITVKQAGVDPSGGSGGKAQILILTLTQSPLAVQTDYTALPTAAATLHTDTAGNGGTAAKQTITLTVPPYGGFFTLDGKQIPWNASATDFAAAYGISASLVNKLGVFSWQYTQSGNGAFVSTFDVSTLAVPTGFLVVINLSTDEFFVKFNSESGDSISCRFTIRVTFPGELPKTFFLSDVDVYRTILSTTVLVSATASIITPFGQSLIQSEDAAAARSILSVPVLIDNELVIPDSLYLGDSTSEAGIYGPSGPSIADDGNGGWVVTQGGGSYPNALTIGATDSGQGNLIVNGSLVAKNGLYNDSFSIGGDGGVSLAGGLFSIDASTGAVSISGGHAFFGSDGGMGWANGLGHLNGDGGVNVNGISDIFADGGASLANGAFTVDGGSGAVTVFDTLTFSGLPASINGPTASWTDDGNNRWLTDSQIITTNDTNFGSVTTPAVYTGNFSASAEAEFSDLVILGPGSLVHSAANNRTILDPAKGPVIYSPNNSAWALAVSNLGVLTVVAYP